MRELDGNSFFDSIIPISLFIFKCFFCSLIYTVLMQNRSFFTRKQTCNGKYTKHCTRTRHQLKMATPAEVSKRRSNFRIRQFKEKRHYNIAANLTFNMTVSFVTLLIARTARIVCVDRHTHTHTYTHTHTHTQDDYCNPLCATRRGLIIFFFNLCIILCFYNNYYKNCLILLFLFLHQI